MELRYDDDFLESAVFLCARAQWPDIPKAQISQFHRERERLYAVADPDQRERAFFQLHLEWFREWGREKLLADLLTRFPWVCKQLDLLAFRKARSGKDEGAELYVHDLKRNGVIALRVERLERNEILEPFLNHELMHLHDMLDPAFGYSRDLRSGIDVSHQSLVRERYRLLWDTTIDGRLLGSGRRTTGNREMHFRAFSRAYSFWDEGQRGSVFEVLWTNPTATHAQLVELACDPRHLAEADQPMPGAPCPLCQFPTFQWASVETLKPEVKETVQREFPKWTPQRGVCARCAEIYKNVGRFAQLAS